MPKYGNSASGPQKWNFSKFFHFCGKVSRFRFWRALNHPQTLSLSDVMQGNVILAYYAEIWKFDPRLPKMEFFKKISFFWKGLQISFPTSPQPPADIKFKSSYARKRIIKKVESRTQLLNPEQGETSPLLKGSMGRVIGGGDVMIFFGPWTKRSWHRHCKSFMLQLPELVIRFKSAYFSNQ